MMTATTGFAGVYEAIDETEVTLRRLRRLVTFLDTGVRLPGGFRFGADSVIGLVPGVGDLATTGISCYFIYEARRLGLPTTALAAMAGNVGLNLVMGATPVLGDLADTWFKANVRNLAIIEKHLARRRL